MKFVIILSAVFISSGVFALDGFFNTSVSHNSVRTDETREGDYSSTSHILYASDVLHNDFQNSSLSFSGFMKADSGDNTKSYDNKSLFDSRITELYLSAGGDNFFIDMGKKHINTGSSMFRSPTYYLDPAKVTSWKKDTNSEKKTKEGLIGIKLEYIGNNFSAFNFFSPEIHFGNNYENKSGYFSTEQEYHRNLTVISAKILSADISFLFLYTHGKDFGKYNMGSTINISVGDRWTFYTDSSVADKTKIIIPDNPDFYSTKSKQQKWVPTCVAGSSFTATEKITIYAEYLYNGSGLKGKNYDKAGRLMHNLNLNYGTGASSSFSDNYGLFALARHYSMIRGSFTVSESLTLVVMNILNLQDKSGLLQNEFQYDAGEYSVLILTRNYYGKKRSEAGEFLLSRELLAEAEILF